MNGMEFYDFFVNYWGNKASNMRFISEENGVECTLYDAFSVRCGLGGSYGTFEGGVVLSKGHSVTRFFGKQLSLNKDEKSIIESFETIDNYCRLRLPDKYLAEYEKSLKN